MPTLWRAIWKFLWGWHIAFESFRVVIFFFIFCFELISCGNNYETMALLASESPWDFRGLGRGRSCLLLHYCITCHPNWAFCPHPGVDMQGWDPSPVWGDSLEVPPEIWTTCLQCFSLNACAFLPPTKLPALSVKFVQMFAIKPTSRPSPWRHAQHLQEAKCRRHFLFACEVQDPCTSPGPSPSLLEAYRAMHLLFIK